MDESWVEASRGIAQAEWDALMEVLREGAPASRGPSDASVAILAEAMGERAHPSQAAEPLERAFNALGKDLAGVRLIPVRRGEPAPKMGWARLLAWELEVVDPAVVIALGKTAAAMVREALPTAAADRRLFVLPDPAVSLADAAGKRRFWEALRAIAEHLPDKA